LTSGEPVLRKFTPQEKKKREEDYTKTIEFVKRRDHFVSDNVPKFKEKIKREWCFEGHPDSDLSQDEEEEEE